MAIIYALIIYITYQMVYDKGRLSYPKETADYCRLYQTVFSISSKPAGRQSFMGKVVAIIR